MDSQRIELLQRRLARMQSLLALLREADEVQQPLLVRAFDAEIAAAFSAGEMSGVVGRAGRAVSDRGLIAEALRRTAAIAASIAGLSAADQELYLRGVLANDGVTPIWTGDPESDRESIGRLVALGRSSDGAGILSALREPAGRESETVM